MKIYRVFINDNRYGRWKEPEDSFLARQNIFCVADGITRDPLWPKNFDGQSGRSLLKHYPRPSPAKIAADALVKKFGEFLSLKKQVKLADVKKAFIYCNDYLRQLNRENVKKVDYQVNDYWACVAAGGVIVGQKLYWGGIGDCGLVVFDKIGKVKFQTPDWVKPAADYFKKTISQWSRPERRLFARSRVRNNPKFIVKGKLIAYGALTGEPAALGFMHFGEIKLAVGDLVIFYSDGFITAIAQSKFFSTIYDQPVKTGEKRLIRWSNQLARKNYRQFGHERTLVVAQV